MNVHTFTSLEKESVAAKPVSMKTVMVRSARIQTDSKITGWLTNSVLSLKRSISIIERPRPSQLETDNIKKSKFDTFDRSANVPDNKVCNVINGLLNVF